MSGFSGKHLWFLICDIVSVWLVRKVNLVHKPWDYKCVACQESDFGMSYLNDIIISVRLLGEKRVWYLSHWIISFWLASNVDVVYQPLDWHNCIVAYRIADALNEISGSIHYKGMTNQTVFVSARRWRVQILNTFVCPLYLYLASLTKRR